MRHFNYFENGGPAPSSCISCGAVKELLEIGQLQFGGMAQVCVKCVKELAVFVGYADEAPLQLEIDNLKNDVEAHEIELARVPDKVEELINGIRCSVTDFIFAVSFGVDADKPAPVQNIASSDSGEHKASKAAAGQRKAPVKPVSE